MASTKKSRHSKGNLKIWVLWRRWENVFITRIKPKMFSLQNWPLSSFTDSKMCFSIRLRAKRASIVFIHFIDWYLNVNLERQEPKKLSSAWLWLQAVSRFDFSLKNYNPVSLKPNVNDPLNTTKDMSRATSRSIWNRNSMSFPVLYLFFPFIPFHFLSSCSVANALDFHQNKKFFSRKWYIIQRF